MPLRYSHAAYDRPEQDRQRVAADPGFINIRIAVGTVTPQLSARSPAFRIELGVIDYQYRTIDERRDDPRGGTRCLLPNRGRQCTGRRRIH
jgi:hypothetical protein